MSELSALAGSEGYGIRDDEVGDVKVPSDYGMATFRSAVLGDTMGTLVSHLKQISFRGLGRFLCPGVPNSTFGTVGEGGAAKRLRLRDCPEAKDVKLVTTQSAPGVQQPLTAAPLTSGDVASGGYPHGSVQPPTVAARSALVYAYNVPQRAFAVHTLVDAAHNGFDHRSYVLRAFQGLVHKRAAAS